MVRSGRASTAGPSAGGARGGAPVQWRRAGRGAARTLVMLLAAGCGAAALSPAGAAQLRLTRDEALRLAFPPPAEIERRTAFLTEEQVEQARELAGDGVEVEDRVVTYYVGVRDGRAIGVAYFDAHRVRTLQEVVMIVVSPQDRIERIEILRFSEPPEYRAPNGWLEQFKGRPLDADLAMKGAIVNITGATLTARAVTRAARRVLALHRVITPVASPPPGGSS